VIWRASEKRRHIGRRSAFDGAFEKAVAIWAAIHCLSALVLNGQLGGVLDQPDCVARLEATVVDLIERGPERPRLARSTCSH